MKVEKLDPTKIPSDYKVIKRSIKNFQIVSFDINPEDFDEEECIGTVCIACQKSIIYKDIDTEKYYEDLLNVEKQIFAYRDDNITLSIIGDYQEQTKITWSPSLEKRFEALYFEGVL